MAKRKEVTLRMELNKKKDLKKSGQIMKELLNQRLKKKLNK